MLKFVCTLPYTLRFQFFRLIKGAKQAGLDPDYIEKLSKTPTYKPNDNVLKARSERPDPEDLEEIPCQFERISQSCSLSWLCD